MFSWLKKKKGVIWYVSCTQTSWREMLIAFYSDTLKRIYTH